MTTGVGLPVFVCWLNYWCMREGRLQRQSQAGSGLAGGARAPGIPVMLMGEAAVSVGRPTSRFKRWVSVILWEGRKGRFYPRC